MAYREVAEPKKPASSNESDGTAGCAAVIAVAVLVVVSIVCSFSMYRAGRESMWVEAVERGYAEKIEHSGGSGYRWKNDKPVEDK